MCFAPMDLPVYDCNSFYWPEQFTLNNCVKMLPTKKDEIEQQFKKNNLRIILDEKFTTERGRINCSLREQNGFWRWLGIQFVVADR